jgi:hypothetical protein
MARAGGSVAEIVQSSSYVGGVIRKKAGFDGSIPPLATIESAT